MKFESPLTTDQRAMVEEALPVARWVVRRYIKSNDNISGLDAEDLRQEAYLALCKAAVTYNGHGARFATYAVTVIRNHLLDYCRAIYTANQKLPLLSLDAPCQDESTQDVLVESTACSEAFENELISRAWVSELLARKKAVYRGCARLGVEALEMKVLNGCGVTELAKLYGVKPNLLGAWISVAVRKLRIDMTAAEYAALSVEKVPEHS